MCDSFVNADAVVGKEEMENGSFAGFWVFHCRFTDGGPTLKAFGINRSRSLLLHNTSKFWRSVPMQALK